MKKNFSIIAILICALTATQAQQVNLGPNSPIQVKGVLQQLYGGTGTNVSIPNCHASNQALVWNPSASPAQFQCNTFAIGVGSVTNVSPSGTNSMFVMSIANQSTTPQISITLSDLINQIFVGSGAGTGAWTTLPSCTGGTNALNYNNSTQTFTCLSVPTGTLSNSVTFQSSGGAAPSSSFNGSDPLAVDYHTVGAPSTTGTGASGTWGINISGQAATVANSVTFNDSGAGAASPIVFNGSSAFTVSYNTIGAPSTTGTGASGNWSINAATATALATTPTQCSGQFATGIAANGNANCASALTNPMTTLGDIIIGGASGTPNRLGIGTTGQSLTVVSGSPAWSGTPLTAGTNGYYKIDPDGTIHEYINTGALNNNTPTTVTIPHTITTLISVVCSDNGGRVTTGNVMAVGAIANSATSISVNTPATGVSAYCELTAQ